MKVGFTGTRWGMKPIQQEVFISELIALRPIEFAHGDCLGADAEAHELVKKMTDAKIIVHPPIDGLLRAYKLGDDTKPTQSHFARNRAIVDSSDVLIATPYEMTQQPRGGTWYTIDYARKKNKQVIIVYPDGRVETDLK